MSAQLRRSARKRKNLPIVAAASARKKTNQRVPDTMSVTLPQLPTVDTGTPFIPITSSTGTYPMLFSQTGAVIYTSASTGPVDLTSTTNTLLYSRVPLPDQRVCNTVTSQDPPEHSLGDVSVVNCLNTYMYLAIGQTGPVRKSDRSYRTFQQRL
ncbi:uncharacterized protein LOC134715486 isoform X2 [Mytilus trossulus]|uniref:uncharacterized protein LOC134715486 isoform X2 n=1 Tax=Mytilus trossulus TaxID=6551 RepID=UPI0030060327